MAASLPLASFGASGVRTVELQLSKLLELAISPITGGTIGEINSRGGSRLPWPVATARGQGRRPTQAPAPLQARKISGSRCLAELLDAISADPKTFFLPLKLVC